MTDMLISTELMDQIKEAILRIGSLKVPWDNQESLSDQQINVLLALPDGLEQVENELRAFHAAYFRDRQREAVWEMVAQYKIEIAREWGKGVNEILGQDIDQIIQAYELYKLCPALDLDMPTIIQHTKPRVVLQLVLFQDYAGWEWPLAMEYEDARDVLQLFNINPRKILPQFPDLPGRNGKEYVNADALRNLWADAPQGGQYVIALDMDLWEYHLRRDQFHTGIVLQKGTEIWLHDYWYGMGSGSSVKLLKDLTILKQNLSYFFGDDNKTIGRGLGEANHFTQEYWSGKIFPVPTKRPAKQTLRPIPKLLRTFQYASSISPFQISTFIAAFNDFSPLENGEIPAPGQKMEMDMKSVLWRQFPIEGKKYLREQADKNAIHLVFRINETIGQVRILHCQFLVNDDTKEVVWKAIQPSARSEEIFEYLAKIIWKMKGPA